MHFSWNPTTLQKYLMTRALGEGVEWVEEPVVFDTQLREEQCELGIGFVEILKLS